MSCINLSLFVISCILWSIIFIFLNDLKTRYIPRNTRTMQMITNGMTKCMDVETS